MNNIYNKTITLPSQTQEKWLDVESQNDQIDFSSIIYNGKLTVMADYFNNIYNGNEESKEQMLNNSFNKENMSLLQISAYLGFNNIFMYLLTYNPNLFHEDINKRNLFHIICYTGQVKILNTLINWERFKNKLISIQNIDSIYKSHGFSKLDIIKGKLSKGVNLTETNINRFNSLQRKLKDETINLIQRNINKYEKLLLGKDKESKNALHYASMNKYTLCYQVVFNILDYEFFKLDGWEEFLSLFSDTQDLEIKPERLVDPRKSLRIEKELENLLGENTIKNLIYLFKSKKNEIIKKAINSQDCNGDTVLHIASFFGDFRIVKKLLHYGADKNIKNDSGKLPVDLAKDDFVRKVLTSLNKAAKQSDSKSITELVNFGHDINNKESIFSQAPLHKIIESKKDDKYTVIKKVLDMGADPSIKDSNGWTALHYACQIGDIKFVEILIESGAKLNCFSNNNRTPLHFAAMNNFPNIVQFLLQNEANPNYKDSLGCSPIHLASKHGNVACINILLAYFADIYSEDFRKWNILHYASFNGHKEAVRFISKYDFDNGKLEKSRNSQNKLPIEIIKNPPVKPYFISLWHAAREGDLDMIRQLLNGSEDVNEQTTFLMNTPLHIAVFNNHYLAVRLLLENGADPNLRNKDGVTSIDYAEVINNVISNKYSNETINEAIDLKTLVRNVLNKKESILKNIISHKNDKIRLWNLNDFSSKIKKILNGETTDRKN